MGPIPACILSLTNSARLRPKPSRVYYSGEQITQALNESQMGEASNILKKRLIFHQNLRFFFTTSANQA